MRSNEDREFSSPGSVLDYCRCGSNQITSRLPTTHTVSAMWAMMAIRRQGFRMCSPDALTVRNLLAKVAQATLPLRTFSCHRLGRSSPYLYFSAWSWLALVLPKRRTQLRAQVRQEPHQMSGPRSSSGDPNLLTSWRRPAFPASSCRPPAFTSLLTRKSWGWSRLWNST